MLAGQCLTPVGVSFVLLVAIASSESRAGKFADAPGEQSGRPGCSLASA